MRKIPPWWSMVRERTYHLATLLCIGKGEEELPPEGDFRLHISSQLAHQIGGLQQGLAKERGLQLE